VTTELALTLAAAATILAAAYRLQAAPLFAVDATVPYGSGRWPNPNASRTPMTTTTHVPAAELDLDDQPIGDLVNTDEDSLIDPDRIDQPVKVIIDVTRARTGDGDHAIAVKLPNGDDGDFLIAHLNAAQAEQLRRDLDLAVPWLAQTRGLQGHQS
jgi:hypothetical protein